MADGGADVGLCDEMRELLFRSGVGGALVDTWAVQEQRRAQHHKRRLIPVPQVPPLVYTAASRCFQTICAIDERLGAPGWYACAGIFHDYCAAAPEAVSFEEMPTICLAIAVVVAKLQDSDISPRRISENASRGVLLTLQELDSETRLMIPAARDVHARELRILRAVRWRVDSPSTYSWVSACYSRLRTLAPERLQESPQLDATWSTVLQGCWALTHTSHPGAAFFATPRSAANGLLVLGLLSAGLVPWGEQASSETSPANNLGDLLQVATVCELKHLQANATAISMEFQRPDVVQIHVEGGLHAQMATEEEP